MRKNFSYFSSILVHSNFKHVSKMFTFVFMYLPNGLGVVDHQKISTKPQNGNILRKRQQYNGLHQNKPRFLKAVNNMQPNFINFHKMQLHGHNKILEQDLK